MFRFKEKTLKTRDEGFSLVEVLCAVTLMGVIVVPTLDAVIGVITTSARATRNAHVETVVQNAADRVTRAPRECDYTIYAEAAVRSEGWEANTVSLQQLHWEPGSTPAAAGSWVSGACLPGASTPADLLVQKIVITVSEPTSRTSGSRTMEVVKSAL